MGDLGKTLRKLRIDYGLTLKEFGEKINITSPSYLSGIERGTIKPSTNFFDSIVANFELDKGKIMEFRELVLEQTKFIEEHKAITPEQIAWARKFEGVDINDENIQKKVDELIITFKTRGIDD